LNDLPAEGEGARQSQLALQQAQLHYCNQESDIGQPPR